MVSRSFEITKRDFVKKFKTIVQKKLRILMKCSCVRDFSVDMDLGTYKFKKSHVNVICNTRFHNFCKIV